MTIVPITTNMKKTPGLLTKRKSEQNYPQFTFASQKSVYVKPDKSDSGNTSENRPRTLPSVTSKDSGTEISNDVIVNRSDDDNVEQKRSRTEASQSDIFSLEKGNTGRGVLDERNEVNTRERFRPVSSGKKSHGNTGRNLNPGISVSGPVKSLSAHRNYPQMLRSTSAKSRGGDQAGLQSSVKADKLHDSRESDNKQNVEESSSDRTELPVRATYPQSGMPRYLPSLLPGSLGKADQPKPSYATAHIPHPPSKAKDDGNPKNSVSPRAKRHFIELNTVGHHVISDNVKDSQVLERNTENPKGIPQRPSDNSGYASVNLKRATIVMQRIPSNSNRKEVDL